MEETNRSFMVMLDYVMERVQGMNTGSFRGEESHKRKAKLDKKKTGQPTH